MKTLINPIDLTGVVVAPVISNSASASCKGNCPPIGITSWGYDLLSHSSPRTSVTSVRAARLSCVQPATAWAAERVPEGFQQDTVPQAGFGRNPPTIKHSVCVAGLLRLRSASCRRDAASSGGPGVRSQRPANRIEIFVANLGLRPAESIYNHDHTKS
jgi:hypothetical protein